MPVNAGTIYSDVRIQLDKLTADVKATSANFDKVVASAENMKKKVAKSSSEIGAQGVTAFGAINAAIKKSIGTYEEFSGKMKKTGGDMTKFITLPVLAIGGAMLKTAADMEMYTAQFETLLGSTEAAGEMLKNLKEFAAVTPFGFSDLAKSSKMMLSFGISASQIMPNLKMLGDIAQGDKTKLDSLTLAFSQIQSTGRLMGQDLLQLINAGFNPLTIIAQKTGRSMADLKKDMEGGKISAVQVAEAFQIATSEGGLFYGGMAKASKTLTGQFSTLMDDVKAVGQSFGEILIPIAKDVIKWISGLVAWFQGLDEGTKRTILTVAGIAAVLGPLIGIIGGVMTAITAINPVMLGITLAIGAVATAVALVSSNIHDNTKEWKTMDEMVQKSAKSVDEFKKSLVGLSFEALSTEKLKKGIKEAREEITNLQEQLKKPSRVAGSVSIAFTTDEAKKTADNNEELARRVKIQERINALMADLALAQEELDKKTKESTTILSEQEKKNQEIREELRRELLTDTQRELEDINRKRDEYIKAGADKMDADRLWANQVIALEKDAAEKKKKLDDAAAEETKKKAEEEQANIKSMITAIQDGIPQIIGAFSSLFSAIYDERLKQLDRQMQAELEAAGVAEDTAVEKAQKELDEARKGGDAQIILEKEKALKKTEIEADYTKRKAQLEYEAAHVKWQFDLAAAVAQGAMMMINAFNSAPFPFNIPAMVVAGVIAGIQIATVATSEPQPPSMAEGGIVLPTSGGRVVRAAENGSPELMLNSGESGQKFLKQFARQITREMGGGVAQTNNYQIYNDVDAELVSNMIVRKIKAAQH